MSVTVQLTTQLIINAFVNTTDSIGNAAQLQVNTGGDSKLNYNSTASNGVVTNPTKFHSSRRTITVSSATLDIDLTTLLDIYQNSFATVSTIYGFYVKNRDLTGGMGLKIGAAGSNPWSGPFAGITASKIQLDPGGEIVLTSPIKGWSVTAGSKVLRFQTDGASSSSVTFDFIIWGK